MNHGASGTFAARMEILPRYFLEIAFCGTAYRGWQRQPDAPSVQAEVERALQFALHQHKVNAIGCGRTDTGVHATRFFLHFDGPSDAPLDDRFMYSLNSLLPDDIAVKRVIAVPDDAHARFSATERGYCYRIHQQKDPFLMKLSHQLKPTLDVAAMNEACKALIGTQDFSSFQKVGTDVKTSICDVREARWEIAPNGYVFRIKADRFLRNMVRAIVGTCMRIGKGQQPASHMGEVLAAKDRHAAGRSAPACGLYLEHVVYPFLPNDLRGPFHG
ncbi:MAG TPA: tRNA pseudouridine(38-40) synthase TruA [Flavobacteriales bacterium]|nr:tRNA pseudouridine(38-40) synthase TruA [Flavobacteriales bacterium]